MMSDIESTEIRKRLPLWIRIILRTLRIFLVPAICVLALYAGLILGYVIVGGKESANVLDWDTWRHLYNLVFAGTDSP
jgi:hypothetical protein